MRQNCLFKEDIHPPLFRLPGKPVFVTKFLPAIKNGKYITQLCLRKDKNNTHHVLKCFQLNINEALQKMTDRYIFFYLL